MRNYFGYKIFKLYYQVWTTLNPASVLNISILALLLSFSEGVKGQSLYKPQSIVLQAQAMPFTPAEFYIAKIIDERPDRSAVAWVLPPAPPAQQVVTTPMDLEGGGLHAIQQFIKKSLPQNTKLRPVLVRLKECRVYESYGAKGRINGQVSLVMSFELPRDEDTVHLVDYQGGARYDRPAGHLGAIAPALQRSLITSLRYLDTWMNSEAPGNEKLAKEVKVSIKEYSLNAKDDTVFYHSDRPLVWDDFRDRPPVSPYAASIFPSFTVESHNEVKDGTLHVNLILKIYMLKTSSWVKDHARDAYSLNHEQRHFDIVKLVAERFKQKIAAENLSVKFYNNIISYQYIETLREINRLQEQYDGETRHGTDKAAQERWNQRIDEELRQLLTVKK